MTSQHEIHAALWKAADALRGSMDTQMCSECLRALFFWKYVSDVERHRVGSAPPRFCVPREADFHVLLEQCETPGIAARINTALAQLERANPDKLYRLFADFKLGAAALHEQDAYDKALGSAVRILGSDTVDLCSSHLGEDEAVRAFEFLMAAFPAVSSSYAGELYTPTEVSTLMAQLVDPRPGDSIYDPVCGSASLLLTCARGLQERYNSREYALHGQEINRSSWRLAEINSFLHGEDGHRIECGDTLREPLHVKGNTLERFDVVVANPPFSLQSAEPDTVADDRFGRSRWGRPPRGRADYAFILHMIESMNPDTGRIVTIAPHGVLFRGGSEADIRRNLIESNLLDAVVGLPSKLFHNTGIATAILCFRANRKEDHVLFIDASRDFASGRKRNELRPQDIERIVVTFQQRADVPDYARLVSRKDLADNGFNLNIARYVKSTREEPRANLHALAQRQRELGAELETIRDGIEALLQQMGGEDVTRVA